MRCFVAVEVPEEIKTKIANLQKTLGGDIKLVESTNLHFTLKFLGEIDEDKAEKVKTFLIQSFSTVPAFQVSLRKIGVFPSEKFMQVVWLGCESREFHDLHELVENSLSSMFKPEKSSPHLTIARIRSVKNIDQVKSFVEKNREKDVGKMEVDRVFLKKSTLTKEGPVYENIGEFLLC